MVRIAVARLVLVAVLVVVGATAGCSGSSGSGSGGSRSGGSRSGDATPSATSTTVTGVSYAPASQQAQARFAPATRASRGIVSSSSVRTLRVSGREVGGVAVYGIKPGLVGSQTFRAQYVVQLINAVAGRQSSPHFVRAADGQVMALSTGAPGVAGWFDGDRVVLVYRQGRSPDLVGLALGVRQTPPGR